MVEYVIRNHIPIPVSAKRWNQKNLTSHSCSCLFQMLESWVEGIKFSFPLEITDIQTQPLCRRSPSTSIGGLPSYFYFASFSIFSFLTSITYSNFLCGHRKAFENKTSFFFSILNPVLPVGEEESYP